MKGLTDLKVDEEKLELITQVNPTVDIIDLPQPEKISDQSREDDYIQLLAYEDRV